MPSSMFTHLGEEDDDDRLTLSQLLGRHPHASFWVQGEPGQGGCGVLVVAGQRAKRSRSQDATSLDQSGAGLKRPHDTEAPPSWNSLEPTQKRCLPTWFGACLFALLMGN